MTDTRDPSGKFLPGNDCHAPKPPRRQSTGWHSADKRSPEAKATASRLHKVHAVERQLLTDRGGDPTQAQRLLALHASGLAVWLEQQLPALLGGEQGKIGELTTAMNCLRRLLETLGIERVPRDVTTLSDYLEKRARPDLPQ